jgi:CheY-like chemotaxis protein
MGGTLTVSSEPGRGSVFTFEVEAGSLEGVEMIPAPLAEAIRIRPRDASLPRLGGRVLLVDDGVTNRKLIELVLRRAGAEVMSAENGQIAVEMASAQSFDLIFMDMQMPVMDGYTATRTLRQMQIQVPIIALTAHAMKEDRDRCLAAGCSGYLAKPVDQERLLATVAEFTGISAQQSYPGDLVISSKPADPREFAIRSTLPMDDPDFREIVEEFVNRLRESLARMQAAWEAQDLEEVMKQAHWLKGSAGTVGFSNFTEPAARLEKLATARQLESVQACITELRNLAHRIVVDPQGEHDLQTSGASFSALQSHL